MDLSRDQFLAGPRFAEDQYVRVGRGNELDLLQDVLQRIASADNVAKGVCLAQFVAKIVPLQFSLLFEVLNFLERPGVGDRGGCMVGDHPQPDHSLRLGSNAREDDQRAEHFSAIDERLSAVAQHALTLGPLGPRDPLGIGVEIRGQDGLPGRRDPADDPHTQWKATKVAVEPGPVGLATDWIAGTGDQVQTGRLVFAFARGLFRLALITAVARPDQPDACQGHMG